MPGLIGVVSGTAGQDAGLVLEDFLAAMQRGGRLQSEKRMAPGGRWALGRAHLGILQPNPQLGETGELQVLFHGELHNEDELRAQYGERRGFQPDDGVGLLIANLYRLYGPCFAAHLKGAFCAAILDERTKRIILVSDSIGSYPLYWFNGPQRFIFASELRAILRDPAVQPTLNPRALADYLTFGFLLGDKTLALEVRLLPPASTLTYCWQDGSTVLQPYSLIEEMFRPCETSRSQYLDELDFVFTRAVRRSLRGTDGVGLALSGGLDSRAILSAIDCAQTGLVTYTLGVKGCADEVIAKELSRIAGARNDFLELDSRYLTDGLTNIRRMVALTDGMYLSHGLTEMLVSRFLEEADFSILLRGHGGELAKASLAWPLHTDKVIHGMHSKDEFVPYMLGRINTISRRVPLTELLTDEWGARVKDGARRSLEESVADVRLSPADLCSYLYLTEQHRRSTIASLELFRNGVEVRMPFVDTDFLRVLFHGPARWRDGTDIHRAILAAHCPSLLKVRNSNTGAPGDAGPAAEKIWDKINSLFMRCNIYGYRHYHSFERWMKHRWLHSVEHVLLHPESLARGVFRQATLRRLIDETKRGVSDHAYLLQIALILEVWQQDCSLKIGTKAKP